MDLPHSLSLSLLLYIISKVTLFEPPRPLLVELSAEKTVHMHTWKRCRPHPSLQAKAAQRVIATSFRSNVKFTTRPWQRADFASCFARVLMACQARECISMAPSPWQPRLCTRHNSDQLWVFWTCRRAHLLCPLVGYDIRKLSLWKIFFVVYSRSTFDLKYGFR